tara:strand:- start:550 stop:1248 length:699 start_codon:yes stop_codon:yes gene_type:complete
MKSFRYQVKRLSNKLGFDLYPFDNRNSIQNYLSFLFARYDIRDLIDIGANKGQYHNMIRNMGYKGSVYLIEPLEKEWNFLKKNIVSKKTILLERMAIGEKEEIKILYETKNSVSSSLKRKLEEKDIISENEVKVRCLDNVVREINKEDLFIKIDSQGHEYEIVSSLKSSLPQIKFIQAELAINPSYAGEKNYLENIDMFKTIGFELIFLFPGIRDKEGFLSEIEAIFINSKI